jgi:hypothetical protein
MEYLIAAWLLLAFTLLIAAFICGIADSLS